MPKGIGGRPVTPAGSRSSYALPKCDWRCRRPVIHSEAFGRKVMDMEVMFTVVSDLYFSFRSQLL
jgi:hypothetical protein